MAIQTPQQIEAFKQAALLQGYDPKEVESFAAMATAAQTAKQTTVDTQNANDLKMYEEKLRLQRQYSAPSSNDLATYEAKKQIDKKYETPSATEIKNETDAKLAGETKEKSKNQALGAIDRLSNGDIGSITGLDKYLPKLAGSSGAQAKTDWENLKNLLTLAARGQLKGTGQISDFETKMLEKASTLGLSEDLSESEFRRRLGELKQSLDTGKDVMTASPNEQKGKSVGGLFKNAVQNALDLTVNNALNTAKSVGAVNMESSRSQALKIAEDRANDLVNRQMSIVKAIRAEKDPEKKSLLIRQARELGNQSEQSSQNLNKITEYQNPFIKPENVPTSGGLGVIKDAIRSSGSQLAGHLGLERSPSGVSFNPQKAIDMAYERPLDVALIAKGGIDVAKSFQKPTLGTVEKAISSSKISPEENVVTRFGKDVRKDVLNPQAKATPFYADDQAALQAAQEKIGLKGNEAQQLKQLPSAFKKSQTEIKSLLKTAEEPKVDTLVNNFSKHVDDANYDLSDPQFKAAITKEIDRIDSLPGKGAEGYYDLMDKYRDLLKSTRKKIENGTTLLPKEEARLIAFNSLKDTLDSVSPEIRAQNLLQKYMFDLSEGLVKGVKEGGSANIEAFGTKISIPGGKNFIKSLQDLTGRGIIKAGKGLGSIQNALKKP